MEKFVTKQEAKLFRALQQLIGNCVDSIGCPKNPTAIQIKKAGKALFEYEDYERKANKRL